ncbi:MAG: DUF58 domain-containing protein [Chromatiales bacterium]|nr:DUF58 domain-containing protein [Chromatiales bacterium]
MTPSHRLIAALGLLLLPAMLAVWYPLWGYLWLAGSVLLILLAMVDLWHLRRIPLPRVERRLHTTIPVGVWTKVQLQLENRADNNLMVTVHDHHPADCDVRDQPLTVDLPAQRQLTIQYQILPRGRGDKQFAGVDLAIHSALKLWRLKRFLDHPTRVRVYPNFREIAHFALLATDNHLSQMGVRRRQRRGEGSDFHQLREYRLGDALRQIDWKASSRYRRLISKEYQDERDQQLVFLLDCGRHMRHRDEQGAHLDHVLNAMLLLSYVAERQGDGVGFLSFGGIDRWQPPVKGGDLVRRILDRSYDIEPTLEAADYLSAARQLMSLQNRRALIVILTNSRTEEQNELQKAVSILAKRHLVVVADIHEASLDHVLEQPVTDRKSALRFQAVVDYLGERRESHERLQYRGGMVIDSRPQQLPINLVNAYLDVKASGAL